MKKKSKSKEAKFFCESCNSEVPRNAKVCPTCGKFFASVRCPQCGRTGTNDDFKNGCPTCGYAINPDGLTGNRTPFIPFGSNSSDSGKKYKNRGNLDMSIFANRRKSNTYVNSSLPIWVYVSSVFVLVILMICLYSCL